MSQELDNVVNSLELSEDAALQLKTIFEAAISEQAKQIEEEANKKAEDFYAAKSDEFQAQLQEEYEAKGNALVEEFNQKVSDLQVQSDAFLQESVKEWISENKVEVVNTLKLKRLEAFVGGMKNLFEENGFDIPDTEYALAEEKDKEIAKLSESVSVLTARLKTVLDESNATERKMIFSKISEGLSDSQIEKLTALSADIQVESNDEYKKKVEFLKESFLKVAEPINPDVQIVNESEKNTPKKNSRVSLNESIMASLAKK